MKNCFTAISTLLFSALLVTFSRATARAQSAGPGAALRFDGIDDHVVVAFNASLTLRNRAAFEAWLYPRAARCNTIISRGDGGGASDYIFQVGYDGGGVCGVMKVGFFAAGAWDSSITALSLNAWTHVVVTFDGTYKQFFVNGLLERTAARVGTFFKSGSPVFIGRQDSGCNCNLYKGQLDELRIWNTVPTPSQICQNVNPSLMSLETGFAAYCQFDEAGGLTTTNATTLRNAITACAGRSSQILPWQIPDQTNNSQA